MHGQANIRKLNIFID